MLKFGNVITAMVTALLLKTGILTLTSLIHWQDICLETVRTGYLVAGTTGEGATLTEEERLRLFRFAADE